jgi:hypothetical protein
MLKKIFSLILLLIWIYILLIFLKPWLTDNFEKNFWVNISQKIRWFKKIADWKKTFEEFKKNYIDSVRKKVIDTKQVIDEKIKIMEDWAQKIEETKEKIEKIKKIITEKESFSWNIEKLKKSNDIDEKILENLKEKLKQKSDIEKKEDVIEYNVMWDLNDF